MAYETRVRLGVSLFLLCVSPSQCIGVPMKDGNVHIEGKIVGGQKAPLGSFPYAVQFFNSGSLCGATILSSWSVMTAAHCFDTNNDTDDMEVHIGSRYIFDFTADRYNVLGYVQHENYNKATLACDIALVFVSRSITFSTLTSKAKLVNTDEWMFARQSHFTATGWGETTYRGGISKDGMMMTNLQFVSAERCSQMNNMTLTPDMFCLYGDGTRGVCRGDSGGGVEWNGMIVGVVSYGSKGGCAQKDKPSVYANVWYFRRWIGDKMDIFIKDFCENTAKIENSHYNRFRRQKY